jgi:hypothetical protein
MILLKLRSLLDVESVKGMKHVSAVLAGFPHPLGSLDRAWTAATLRFFMSGQLADKRSDLVPRFAGDDHITAFNLVRVEIKVR